MDNKFFKSLEANSSVLLLVDYQARMFWGATSHDPTYVKNNVMALAKGAEILGIPTVLTTIGAKNNGAFLPEIVEMFPDVPIIDRKVPSFDAFEDQEVFDAVKKTARKQLVISGLWTSMCMSFTSLRGLREGFDVFGVMDAAAFGVVRCPQHGGATHDTGRRRTLHLDANHLRMDAQLAKPQSRRIVYESI